jgi:hypothetical protein
MQTITLTQNQIDSGTWLTPPGEDLTLVHVPPCSFAVLGMLDVCLFAFKSIVLANYLSETGRELRSVLFQKEPLEETEFTVGTPFPTVH